MIAAERADRAAAHFDGRTLKPGSGKVDAARAAFAAAEKERDALSDALGDAIDEVWRVVEQHRDHWAAKAAVDRDEKRATYAAAVDSMLEARREYRDAATIAYALAAPGRTFKPSGGTIGEDRQPFEPVERLLGVEAGLESAPHRGLGEHRTANDLVPAEGVAA